MNEPSLFLLIRSPHFLYYGGVQPMFEAINEAKNEFLIFPEQGLSISWFVSATIMTALAFYMFPHMLAGVFSAKSAKSLV
jgi:SSS family solute:Na+ symporter